MGRGHEKEGDPEPDLIWRDEARLGTPVNGRSIKVQLLPLSEFLKLFYCVAYEDRSLIIGYDLPRELTRLASDWHEIKKGEKVGGWKLALWTYLDPNTGSSGRAQVGGPRLSSSGSRRTSPSSNSPAAAARAIEGSSLTYRTWRTP